jgi:SAM-dependent methyltransferase
LEVALNRYSPEARALHSGGESERAIYRMVADTIVERSLGTDTIIDVGCGAARLWPLVRPLFNCYIGVDLVRYDSFPREARLIKADLNHTPVDLPAASADVVVAVETIEHLENPRAFMRELVRLAKPAGSVLVTTPNQLSLLGFFCLLLKQRFAHFQDVHYPAHITPLLEIDLLRIAGECGLHDKAIRYSESGRIILTSRHYPRRLSRMFPRALSDNLLVLGQKPTAAAIGAASRT